jgi:hypothetical protein
MSSATELGDYVCRRPQMVIEGATLRFHMQALPLFLTHTRVIQRYLSNHLHRIRLAEMTACISRRHMTAHHEGKRQHLGRPVHSPLPASPSFSIAQGFRTVQEFVLQQII